MWRFLALALLIFPSSLPLAAQDLLVNRGALIHIQPDALVQVEGSVLNENDFVHPGEIENYGRLVVLGDWTNNSLGPAFLHRTDGEVVFAGGQNEQHIKGTSPTHFNNLLLQKPNGTGVVVLENTSSADGILDLDDDVLEVGEYQFFMQNPAPEAILRRGGTDSELMHSTSEGYVRATPGSGGGLARTLSPDYSHSSYLFPVGSSLRFRPVALSAELDSPNVYLVRFVDATPADRLALGEGLSTLNPMYHHLIQRRDSGDARESIRVYHDFVEDDICDIDHVALAQHDGALWQDLGPAQSHYQAPFMSFTELQQYPDQQANAFAPSTIALAGKFINSNLVSCVFPAEFLELNVWAAANHIQLEWETNSEFHNLGFEVLRSNNGRDFQPIGWRSSVGSSTSPTPYTFEDESAERYKLYFYRIRQLDQNGFEKFSNTGEAVLVGDGEQVIGNFFPNPSAGEVRLWASLPRDEALTLLLFNDLGQLAQREERELHTGYQVMEFDLNSLATGIYLAQIRLGKERLTRRIVLD